ncbi:glucose-induced degradation protein 8 homolog [Watersipora subatra]|uniref:glucose-induced degradation protein 8 homolog n=1 Tax=Watersipora subatra TaxID=2589382 RepID=UPI00355BFBB2
MMEVTQKDEDMLEEWTKKLRSVRTTRADMNLLVMDYLEKEGFKEAAEKFRVEAGVTPTMDLGTIDKRLLIRSHLQNGEIDSAVAIINEIHPELLDNDNLLYFKIQQQQLIELIRQKDIEKALDFAQTHLAERAEDGDEDVLSELERTLALLAFDDPFTSPFGDLLQPSHRHKVASEVNAKILEQENQEPVPQITKILKLLAWSQQQLDIKNVKYVRMTDFAKGNLHLS